MKFLVLHHVSYRITVSIIGIAFLFMLNFGIFGRMFTQLTPSYRGGVVVLGLLLFYLIKFNKYAYVIEDGKLKIHAPLKIHTADLKDIKKVGLIEKIPVNIWLWHKYDVMTASLYFVWWSDKWVVLTMKDGQKIVVAPRRRNEFVKILEGK